MTNVNPPYALGSRTDHTAALVRRALRAAFGAPGVTLLNAGVASGKPSDDLRVQVVSGQQKVSIEKGGALIDGSTSDPGLYGGYLVYNDGTTYQVNVTPSSAAGARIDLVIARVNDQDVTGASNTWAVEVVTGTASGSPAVPAVPSTGPYLLLARLDVPQNSAAGAFTVTDQRVWAKNADAMNGNLPRGNLGYAEAVASQGSITAVVDLTGLSVTVTVPQGGRRVRITGQARMYSSVGTDSVALHIYEGSTQLQSIQVVGPGPNNGSTVVGSVVLTPSAGTHTYKLRGERAGGTGTVTAFAAANAPNYILVEEI